MTDCNEAVRPIHDRMPVLLRPDQWEVGLHGDFEVVLALQTRCYPDELLAIDRTSEPWAKRVG